MTAPADARPLDRPLQRRDIKTLVLAALGGALEFYDFVIFVFFTAAIGQLFFPPDIDDWLRQFQTYGLFAAGYLARPLGGIVMAHFGDRIGRKRMFTLSVFLMALPTLAMGLLPTYAQIGAWAPIALLLLRILQGAAIGGEVPGAWTFVAEHVPRNRIGIACASLSCGLTSGILIGSLVATAINLSFTPEEIRAWAWRLPFLLGGVLGFFAVWLRRWLHETPVFEALRERKELSRELPLKAVLRAHLPSVLMSVLITWTLTASIVVVILLTPGLVQKLFAIPSKTALIANNLATLSLSIGCLCFGWAADRFGAERMLAIGTAALAACVYALYHTAAAQPQWLAPVYTLTGFSVGIVGVIPVLMVRAFPNAVRFSGVSFSYNVAYAIFGGLTPLVISLAIQKSPMAPAWYVMAVCGIGFTVAILRVLQLRGREVSLALPA